LPPETHCVHQQGSISGAVSKLYGGLRTPTEARPSAVLQEGVWAMTQPQQGPSVYSCRDKFGTPELPSSSQFEVPYQEQDSCLDTVGLAKSIIAQEMNGNGRGNKRQRLEEEQPDTVDVKLSQELRELMGGRTYIKEEELTRAVLLEWAKRQGAVKEVNRISITVQTMGGTELEVKLDDTANTVSYLKQSIQDGHGISAFSQQLFLVSKSGDKAEANVEANVEAKEEPMRDAELLLEDCCKIAEAFFAFLD